MSPNNHALPSVVDYAWAFRRGMDPLEVTISLRIGDDTATTDLKAHAANLMQFSDCFFKAIASGQVFFQFNGEEYQQYQVAKFLDWVHQGEVAFVGHNFSFFELCDAWILGWKWQSFLYCNRILDFLQLRLFAEPFDNIQQPEIVAAIYNDTDENSKLRLFLTDVFARYAKSTFTTEYPVDFLVQFANVMSSRSNSAQMLKTDKYQVQPEEGDLSLSLGFGVYKDKMQT